MHIYFFAQAQTLIYNVYDTFLRLLTKKTYQQSFFILKVLLTRLYNYRQLTTCNLVVLYQSKRYRQSCHHDGYHAHQFNQDVQ